MLEPIEVNVRIGVYLGAFFRLIDQTLPYRKEKRGRTKQTSLAFGRFAYTQINRMQVKRILLIIVLLLCSRAIATAEAWQGIVPLTATRSDVVKLFQQCQDRFLSCEFDFHRDKVRIVFSGMVQDYFYDCPKRLPPDTVLLVEVTPQTPSGIKRFRQTYRLTKMGKTSRFSGYIDEEAGLILRTDKEKVVQLNYIAAASDRRLCEAYYRNPIKFVAVVTHCPPVNINGPSGTISSGDTVNLQADVQSDPKMTLVWIVNGGRILQRIGNRIVIDTSQLAGQTLAVKAQAIGSCSVESSATFQIQSQRAGA